MTTCVVCHSGHIGDDALVMLGIFQVTGCCLLRSRPEPRASGRVLLCARRLYGTGKDDIFFAGEPQAVTGLLRTLCYRCFLYLLSIVALFMCGPTS